MVVLPTYEEAENVVPMVQTILGVADRCSLALRVIVVDDGSPDGTADLADELARGDSRVSVLRRTRKEGIGPAYLAGFAKALEMGAEQVLEMDCDFSHDPKELPRILEAMEHADIVLGSRYVPGGGVVRWGPVRRLISRGGCLYAQAILGVPIKDLTGGFKCFRRDVLEALPLEQVTAAGYGFQIELTYRALLQGFRVVEVPIVFSERASGTSKMSKRIVLEAALLVPRLRLRRRKLAAAQAQPAG